MKKLLIIIVFLTAGICYGQRSMFLYQSLTNDSIFVNLGDTSGYQLKSNLPVQYNRIIEVLGHYTDSTFNNFVYQDKSASLTEYNRFVLYYNREYVTEIDCRDLNGLTDRTRVADMINELEQLWIWY